MKKTKADLNEKVSVTLLVSRVGPDGAFSPGDTIEVTRAEAERLLKARQIKPLSDIKAAVDPAKTAS